MKKMAMAMVRTINQNKCNCWGRQTERTLRVNGWGVFLFLIHIFINITQGLCSVWGDFPLRDLIEKEITVVHS